MGKKEKKDQFIIAYLTDLDKTDAIINNAICFAKMLDKGLILLHISDKEYTKISTQEAEQKLKELSSKISEIPFCSYFAIEGKSKEILHKVSEFLSGVLLVSSSNSDKPENKKQKLANYPKELFKNLYESRVAYFIIDQNQAHPLPFDKVIMTINNMRESKEKVLWGSYFGRFSKSEIIVYYHNYKDEFHRHQLHYNIKFLMKMFDNFKIDYRLNLSSNAKTYVDYQAIEYAREISAGLVICQTTKDKDWTNSIFGLKETKILEDNLDIPILFVNPRNDLFILCE